MTQVDIGVYFNENDYIGFAGRIAILLLDSVFLITVIILVDIFLKAIFANRYDIKGLIWGVIPVVLIGYGGFVKTTRFGGLGYWTLKAKLVDLQGNRPTIVKSIFRSILVLVLPVFMTTHIMLIYNDPHKQGIREKLTGTYLVRRSAVPCGEGIIYWTTIFSGEKTLTVREVKRTIAS